MKKIILITMAFLIVIISRDFGLHRGWCGLTLGKGDKIYINTNRYCLDTFGYDNLLKHELYHSFYFHLPLDMRIAYCDSAGTDYNKECWEEFVPETRLRFDLSYEVR